MRKAVLAAICVGAVCAGATCAATAVLGPEIIAIPDTATAIALFVDWDNLHLDLGLARIGDTYGLLLSVGLQDVLWQPEAGPSFGGRLSFTVLWPWIDSPGHSTTIVLYFPAAVTVYYGSVVLSIGFSFPLVDFVGSGWIVSLGWTFP